MLLIKIHLVLVTQAPCSLQWRHNGQDSVPNHQPHDCLLNHLSDADQSKHQNIGMNDVWIMQGNGFTTDYVNLAVKRRLKDIYLQQWYEDKQKNNFYNTIKDEWNLEYYLTKLNCFQRKILSKFRCRSNYLPVSQIKFYQNEDDWEDCLLCPFCRDDSVGDGFHYLFQCSFFNDERVKYIKEVYLQHPDEYTLISVLNSHNKGILSKLVEFIDLIMKIFEHRSSWDIEDIVQD